MSMVNFGIDLGTTNSLIAKFEKGHVEVFKNPIGFKESLPSVVGFRNDRVLVGDQARTYVEKDSKSVASRFKRKMGTSETFKIKSLGASKTPVELSSIVLKELKGFVHSGEKVEAVVITIPASFDTVQSNATKEAGLAAGFKHVILLQEPIAASLAYANKGDSEDLRNSQWLVYDLGGGTFDVALVRIVEGELTVVDHEGDNYLGGGDFDALIVEKLVVPELDRRGNFNDLLGEMKSENGRHNTLWHVLLSKAEDAKVELSSKSSAEIDLGMISVEDDSGKAIDTILTITRSELESLVKESIDGTTEMMKRILTRNSLQPADLQFILMVGGSTYMPYVRQRVGELMDIPVNTRIDPTNAIAVGAAYFAGAKEASHERKSVGQSNGRNLRIRAAYNRNSQEREEPFSAKVEGDIAGLSYRIRSEDGAFDSGLKSLGTRLMEDLPLREGAFNHFNFEILDEQGNTINVDLDAIQIAQGRYSVAGQMLPEDISLVKDDLSLRDTRLQRIFAKNAVLPTRGKATVEVAKLISKGSDDSIVIIVVEGSSDNHSTTNKPIGVLQISGKQISRDLMKGTEIDLTFEMSESRDLTVSAYLNGTGQEFSQVFSGTTRQVSPQLLAREILDLENKVQDEIQDANKAGNHDGAAQLEKLLGEVQGLFSESASLSDDDVTDGRFKLEDNKRRIAQGVFQITSSKRRDAAIAAYQETKREVAAIVHESGNDREKHQFREIIGREQVYIHSSNPERIEAVTAELDRIQYQILWRTPDFLTGMFEHLNDRRVSMNDQTQAKQLFDHGRSLISKQAWDDLRQVNGQLLDLLPDDERANEDMRLYTGIV